MIFLFVLRSAGWPPASALAQVPAVMTARTPAPLRPGTAIGSAVRKGCAVAAQPSGKAAPEVPRYLHPAEVADILHVSPKTVSRWATEGKLPFLKTWAATAATRRRRSASWPMGPGRSRRPSLVWFLRDGCESDIPIGRRWWSAGP
jgi:hypothetical protein